MRKIQVSIVFAAFLAAGAGAEDVVREAIAPPSIPELDCVIEPSEVVDVGSAVPGVIEAIHARRSDPVAKGMVIAELESDMERATLALSEARAGLTTSIELRRENAAFGRRTRERNQALFQNSSISKQAMDKLETETRVAQLQVRQERDNKHIAELEYRRAQVALKRRTIRSPVKGVVMERFKSVGEYVDDAPVLRVAQLDPLNVEVIVPVDHLGQIRPGMTAEVSTVAPRQGRHVATVTRVDHVADAASGTFGVQLSLSNPDYAIASGLRCKLAFLPADTPAIETTAVAEPDVVAAPMPEVDKAAPPALSPNSPATAQAPANDLAPGPSGECYTVGPLPDRGSASRLSRALAPNQAAEPLVTEKYSSTAAEFLVLAETPPGSNASGGFIAQLKASGVTDFYVLPRGEHRGRVSLGLYRDIGNARARQATLAGKGITAQLVPRHKEAPAYWVNLALQGDADTGERVRSAAAAIAPGASVQPADCERTLAIR